MQVDTAPRPQYRLVLEEIYNGPWQQAVPWGYFTGENINQPFINARTTNQDCAKLFWPDEAVVAVLLCKQLGYACHLDPPLTLRF